MAGEMIQQLRVLAAFLEDLGLIPSILMVDVVPGALSDTLFWPPQAQGMGMMQTYMQAKRPYTKNNKIKVISSQDGKRNHRYNSSTLLWLLPSFQSTSRFLITQSKSFGLSKGI